MSIPNKENESNEQRKDAFRKRKRRYPNMKYETIVLSEQTPNVTLTCYIADNTNHPRNAMLVIPGGGYGCICEDREGEPIAMSFFARGYNCFVLRYRIAPIADPYDPLVDASRAMAYIRQNADAFHIDKDRVFAVGFSAGGHLAATLGTMYADKEISDATGIDDPTLIRPTGVALCYPVISPEAGHVGTFANLFGKRINEPALNQRFSAEKRVTPASSPAFIIHTFTDQVVPVRNSLVMAQAMADNGVLCELHVYPKGPHGMALANRDTDIGGKPELVDAPYARWVDDACTFFARIR